MKKHGNKLEIKSMETSCRWSPMVYYRTKSNSKACTIPILAASSYNGYYYHDHYLIY